MKHVCSCQFLESHVSHLTTFSFALADRVLSHLILFFVFLIMSPDNKVEARPKGHDSASSIEIAGNNFAMPQRPITSSRPRLSASVPVQFCLR